MKFHNVRPERANLSNTTNDKEQSYIILRALALSILNLNYTLEIALHINNQLKN